MRRRQRAEQTRPASQLRRSKRRWEVHKSCCCCCCCCCCSGGVVSPLTHRLHAHGSPASSGHAHRDSPCRWAFRRARERRADGTSAGGVCLRLSGGGERHRTRGPPNSRTTKPTLFFDGTTLLQLLGDRPRPLFAPTKYVSQTPTPYERKWWCTSRSPRSARAPSDHLVQSVTRLRPPFLPTRRLPLALPLPLPQPSQRQHQQ